MCFLVDWNYQMLFQTIAIIEMKKIETLVNSHIIVDLSKQNTNKIWSIVCFLNSLKSSEYESKRTLSVKCKQSFRHVELNKQKNYKYIWACHLIIFQFARVDNIKESANDWHN